MVSNVPRMSRRALGIACIAATLAAVSPAGAATTTTTPAGGAQPGTVAPASTTPASTATPAGTTTSSTTTSAKPTSTSPTGTVVVVTHKTNSQGTRLSTGTLILAVLGALLALGAIVWALTRWLALEPRWTVSLMYSLREASDRTSATWAEFADWVRIGR